MWWRCNILLLILFLTASCGTSNQLPEVVETPIKGWYSPVNVSFNVADTVSIAQMNLLVRYSNEILADSVELMVTTTAPDGVSWSEPFVLYTPHSREVIKVTECNYRRNVRWSQLGEYTVTFHPQHTYHGIGAIGVNIIYSDR